jgi:large subunit ribosomal protein L25
MSSLTLEVTPRHVIGKQVNALRRQGFIPAVIYGPKQADPVTIQTKWADLRPVLSRAGGTSLIELNLEGKKISVLARDVQRHPIRQEVVTHVDFFAVDLDKIITANLPVVIANPEAEAKRLAAKLFQSMFRIDVECLPSHIPSKITVDMSVIKRAGKHVTVKMLPQLEGVTYLEDSDKIVVRTVSLTKGAVEEEDEYDPNASMDVEVISKGKQEEEEF